MAASQRTAERQNQFPLTGKHGTKLNAMGSSFEVKLKGVLCYKIILEVQDACLPRRTAQKEIGSQ